MCTHRSFVGFLAFALIGCGSGTVRVSLTDAPLDGATAVNVAVSAVDVHISGSGWQTVTSEQQTFNLLDLQGGITALVGESEMPTGRITQVRLQLAQDPPPTIEDGSGSHEAKVPSGYETGIKLVGCFEVSSGETTQLTLDFDAGASVTQTPSGYGLQPVIKIVEAPTCKGSPADAADAGSANKP